MCTNRSPSEFTVAQLKDMLKVKGLNMAGVKSDLINRLVMNDPTGAWMDEAASRDPSATASGNSVAGAIASADSGVDEAPSANSPRPRSSPITDIDARSMDIQRRELELAEREIQLLRREVEMMREMQRLNIGGVFVPQSAPHVDQRRAVVIDESMKAMLSYLEGNGENFDIWEKQLTLLRSTYRLDDNAAKLLVVSRLKNKALEWFHSKPEYIEMRVDDIVSELRDTFGDRQSKISARREFEGRTWRKEETFAEYFHRKTILANRISIDEGELIEYLIDGIPDHSLRNHAKLQKFVSKASLLEGFKGVTLPPAIQRSLRANAEAYGQKTSAAQCGGAGMQRSDGPNYRGGGTISRASYEFRRPENSCRGDNEFQRRDSDFRRRDDGVQRRDDGMQRREARNTPPKRCYNCGDREHLSFECHRRSQGAKCFECGEFGHVAKNCPRRVTLATDESLAVQQEFRKKYVKNVCICEREVTSLINTSRDYKNVAEQLQKKTKMLQSTETKLNSVLSNLTKKIESLKEQNTSLSNQNQQLQDLCTSQKISLSRTEESKNILNTEVETLKGKLKNTEESLHNEKVNSVKLNEVLEEAKLKICENIKCIQSLRHRNNSYETSIENCNTNLKEIIFPHFETKDSENNLNDATTIELVQYLRTLLRKFNKKYIFKKREVKSLNIRMEEIKLKGQQYQSLIFELEENATRTRLKIRSKVFWAI
ncbi:uncharacterized protein LOC128882162 [Hylaeus volcanicus]|uniref:uncharacterized protein LOC128882162 n=1 Tax=Hylaeus volcanicus TaxID=313075 RepID=UPI0023B7E14D|nr:uncharacterized protein LOC128882162 [Hylaeus volcanicus]